MNLLPWIDANNGYDFRVRNMESGADMKNVVSADAGLRYLKVLELDEEGQLVLDEHREPTELVLTVSRIEIDADAKEVRVWP